MGVQEVLLSKSWQSIVEANQDRLRGRRFVTTGNAKPSSIHARLAKTAGSHINKISTFYQSGFS